MKNVSYITPDLKPENSSGEKNRKNSLKSESEDRWEGYEKLEI